MFSDRLQQVLEWPARPKPMKVKEEKIAAARICEPERFVSQDILSTVLFGSEMKLKADPKSSFGVHTTD